MKKTLHLLAFLALFCLPWVGLAQTEVLIGEGTTTSQYLPGYNFYNYSISQQIYTADEIGLPGSITSVAFQNTGSEKTRTYNVYFALTDKNEFTSTSDWVPMSDADLVFAGTVTFPVGVWTSIDLDVPFAYDGTSNLIITVTDVTGIYTSSPHMSCLTTTATNQSLYKYQDSSPFTVSGPGVTGTRPAFKNQIVLTIIPNGGAAICSKPASLNVFGITSDEATFSWSNTDAGLYQFESKPAADTVWGQWAPQSDTVFTLYSLSPNTAYSARVKALCPDGTESGYRSLNFRTACAAISALPFSMGFEDADLISTSANVDKFPWCWTRINDATSTSYTYYPYCNTSYPYSGSRSLQFTGGTSTTLPEVQVAVLPPLDVDIYPMNANRVTFWARTSGASYSKVLYVGTLSDPADFNSFAFVDSVVVTGTTYAKFSVPLFAANPSDPYIAIWAKKNNGTLYLDDLTLEEMPSCLEVASVAVSGATSSSLTLSWVPNEANPNASYSIYIISENGNILVASGINGTSFSVDGLNPNTQYTLGVQANCPAGDAAIMTATGRTTCAAYHLPFSESFDATLASDPCWAGASSPTADEVLYGSSLNLGANSIWTYSSSESNGLPAGHYRVNIYGTSCKKWMVTPEIDLSSASNPLLTFDAAFTKYSGTAPAEGFESNSSQLFYVLVTADGGLSWQLLSNVSLASIASTSYLTQYLSLAPYAGQTVRLAFYAQSTVSGGDNNLHLDNILVSESTGSICYAVSDIAVSSVTSSSAILSWLDLNNPVASYVVYDMNDSGAVYAVVDQLSVELSGLYPNTLYTFGIAASCSDGDIQLPVTSYQ